MLLLLPSFYICQIPWIIWVIILSIEQGKQHTVLVYYSTTSIYPAELSDCTFSGSRSSQTNKIRPCLVSKKL